MKEILSSLPSGIQCFQFVLKVQNEQEGQDKVTKEQRKQVRQSFESVTISSKGIATVKHEYFYRIGISPEILAARVLKAFPQATIIEKGDHFAPWPKDSYIWVKFTLPEPSGPTAG